MLRAAAPFVVLTIALAVAGCANIGNPSGGPRDEDPPIFVSANPPMGALNVNKTKMSLTFNEIINVKDAFQKVVVSPVSKVTPKVSFNARTVQILFDSLQPNQTYTVDFADAIEDNNEGNVLEGFTYTFSTGQELDSLRVSGMVINSRTSEPEQGMIVGVHADLADTTFRKLPPLRVAKTNDKGEFTIRGLKPGRYHIFALGDRDNDWKFSTPEEDIAFSDFIIEPTTESVAVTDTLFTALGEVDTIIQRKRTRFLPNDILLRSFNTGIKPQYLAKYERIDSTRLYIKLNAPTPTIPKLAVIMPQNESLSDAVIEHSLHNDSLVVWLPDRLVHRDSLSVAVSYPQTDADKKLIEVNDTLKFNFLRPKIKAKGKERDKSARRVTPEDSIKAITLNVEFSPKSQDIDKPFNITFETPLQRLDTNAFHLEHMVDTVWKRVARQPRLQPVDSLSPRHFELRYGWEYDKKYRVVADTMAAVGIYGKPTRPISYDFTTKKEDEYCAIIFRLQGLDPAIPAFVELLDGSDKLVKSQRVVNDRVEFRFLAPGKYYARLIEDFNGNGEYDPGDYDTHRQPDQSYYYPKLINLKKNWDKDETWNVYATPVNQMKPEAIKRNKPKQKKNERSNRNNRDLDNEEDAEFDPTRNPFDPKQSQHRRL